MIIVEHAHVTPMYNGEYLHNVSLYNGKILWFETNRPPLSGRETNGRFWSIRIPPPDSSLHSITSTRSISNPKELKLSKADMGVSKLTIANQTKLATQTSIALTFF